MPGGYSLGNFTIVSTNGIHAVWTIEKILCYPVDSENCDGLQLKPRMRGTGHAEYVKIADILLWYYNFPTLWIGSAVVTLFRTTSNI